MGFWNRVLQQQMDDRRLLSRRSYKHEGPFEIGIESAGPTHRWERNMFESDRQQQFNQDVKAWAQGVNAALKVSVSTSGMKGRMLGQSLRPNFKMKDGEVERVGFKFLRYGVYVHKGVGRGYVMKGSSVVKTTRRSKKERVAREWFNPVLKKHMPDLVDIVQQYASEATINTLRIFIR